MEILFDFLEYLEPKLWEDLANIGMLKQFLKKLMPLVLVNYY